MNSLRHYLKYIVAAIVAAVMFSLPAVGGEAELDALFKRLQSADSETWEPIEQEIWAEWSNSGSAAADLLLNRGRSAMAAGDLEAAIEHLTALTDYAPDFAEGWNARATAYFQANLYGPSVNDIGRVLALNPRHFGALSGLGMILEELGYEKEALKAYREVQEIHPHRPNVQEAIDRLQREVAGQDL